MYGYSKYNNIGEKNASMLPARLLVPLTGFMKMLNSVRAREVHFG